MQSVDAALFARCETELRQTLNQLESGEPPDLQAVRGDN
jgi:hypothetical protein